MIGVRVRRNLDNRMNDACCLAWIRSRGLQMARFYNKHGGYRSGRGKGGGFGLIPSAPKDQGIWIVYTHLAGAWGISLLLDRTFALDLGDGGWGSIVGSTGYPSTIYLPTWIGSSSIRVGG